MIKTTNANAPEWKPITVQSKMPGALVKLDEMAHNMWWTWNTDAYNLYHDIAPDRFKATNHNVIEMLGSLSYEDLTTLSQDAAFLARMDKVYQHFRTYMDEKPDATRPSVAYFCMEYGLYHFLRIYSGGLGILAGDYLKQASDSNVDLTAVGLLYRYGYFTQELAMDGSQIAKYEAQDFERLPINKVMTPEGRQMVLEVPFPGYTLYAQVWRVDVGRVKLYLLDTDIPQNSEFDRPITHTLYGGDWENRLKQEVLLGIGGMMLLDRLGIHKDIYHCNEGHAALCNVERLVDYVQKGYTFDEALELVKASSLYTVHTPVPAGHDYFDEGLFGKYMGQYPQKLGISWDEFMGLGRMNPQDKNERFCMSTFLCKTCQEVNGVSKLHGKVSQYMFNGIWGGYLPEENHVGYVTNGVHLPTWASREWKALYEKYLGKNFYKDQSNEETWESIYSIPDKEIWDLRVKLKTKLIKYIRERFAASWLKNQGDPTRVVSLLDKINPNALLIGFGRRFATYKRAHLLFTDLERLSKIVNNPDYPVQFIFAGKAHPADGAGQGLIKQIYEISQRPEFLGKILLAENYDMQLARRLVSGVDIWMNTPTRTQEASGTSGEKALMNGLLNFSILDGWWLEGYRPGAGWAITERRTYQSQEHQDRLDAYTIYSMLEHEIIPLYYQRNQQGYSSGWIQAIKNSLVHIAPHYTMKRQLDDYYSKFYQPEAVQYKILAADNGAKARELAKWKQSVADVWDKIQVTSFDISKEIGPGTVISGEPYTITLTVDEQGLNDAIGVEMVVITTDDMGRDKVYKVFPFDVVSNQGSVYTFRLKASLDNAGTFRTAYRLYPKNSLLVHRQNFCYVKWFTK